MPADASASTTTVPGAEVRRPARRRTRVNLLPYALIAPAVIMVAILTIYPAIFAVYLSLTDANLLRWNSTELVGLQNYQNTLKDPILGSSIWRTVRWVLVVGVASMPIALGMALLLHCEFTGRGFLRSVILIPWVTPGVVQAIIFRFMVDANYGVFNDVLVRLGIIRGYMAWMSEALTSFAVVAFVQIWAGLPFVTIVLLAGLQAIPDELYEAARVDGAGAWQRFRYITLPMLVPLMLLILLLRTIGLAHAVDMIFLLTGGGPGYDNYTIAVYSFRLLWQVMDLGYPSAIAILLSIILLCASVIYHRLMERSKEWA